MHYITSYLWEQGARPDNQDSLSILNLTIGHTPYLFATVADGIGGLSKGSTASAVLVHNLKCAFEEASHLSHPPSRSNLKHLILRELYRTHLHLLEYGRQHDLELGTTCSLVCIAGTHGFAIHIGDSHIYHRHHRLFPNPLRRTTTYGPDHIDSSGHLTRCIGHGSFHRIHCYNFTMHTGDSLVLCTDGYYRGNRLDNSTAITISSIH